MNLKMQAIERRLTVLLAYHQKLIMDGAPMKRIDRLSRLIYRLVKLFEAGAPRLRFDGPLCLDRADSPDMWTVVDSKSPFFRMTNCRETMLARGFSEAELNEAKGVTR